MLSAELCAPRTLDVMQKAAAVTGGRERANPLKPRHSGTPIRACVCTHVCARRKQKAKRKRDKMEYSN